MKVYVDFGKKLVTKVEYDKITLGDNNAECIEIVFSNYDKNIDLYYASMSAILPNKQIISPRSYDTDGKKVEGNNLIYSFTMSRTNGWILPSGKITFNVWISYVDRNTIIKNYCVASFMVNVFSSSGYSAVENPSLNPELKKLIITESTLLRGASEETINNSTENLGMMIGTDTGFLYYWNGYEYVKGMNITQELFKVITEGTGLDGISNNIMILDEEGVQARLNLLNSTSSSSATTLNITNTAKNKLTI